MKFYWVFSSYKNLFICLFYLRIVLYNSQIIVTEEYMNIQSCYIDIDSEFYMYENKTFQKKVFSVLKRKRPRCIHDSLRRSSSSFFGTLTGNKQIYGIKAGQKLRTHPCKAESWLIKIFKYWLRCDG